jgi:hypothetical protein
MIPFITLIMVDVTVYKSLIMSYQSLKYNFILKNMLKTAFGLSEWNQIKALDKPIKPQIRIRENRSYFLGGLGLMFRLCCLDWVITLGPSPPTVHP